MSIYLGNAFSLQMLDPDISNTIQVDPVDLNEVAKADFISVVGHADTAIILSRILGRKVVMNRASHRLTKEDVYLWPRWLEADFRRERPCCRRERRCGFLK